MALSEKQWQEIKSAFFAGKRFDWKWERFKEYLSESLERISATEPAMKCRSCDTTTDKTPPFAACGICGAQLVDKVATEPETVDALDQLAMSLQWEQLYTDDYKRRVLREAVQFVLQGGAHERTPTP